MFQKSDGTCNTNFKKTKHREQVMQALEDFVGGNTQILVGLQSLLLIAGPFTVTV